MNQAAEQTPAPERDLDEVLRSLEVELFGPPKGREDQVAPAVEAQAT